ncbi:MAG TPA: DUF2934 domain-containing protein [Chthoniobacterales bacterium]|nr:DUF2934 domain-containing protein [Chthoniobacterales bacterium]
MPRKTKSPAKEVDAPANGSSNPEVSATKTRRAPAKAARKSPARKAGKKASTKAGSAAPTALLPTDEDIRLRAYFIAERRHRLALPGDADSDWLEAKRQLMSETGPH